MVLFFIFVVYVILFGVKKLFYGVYVGDYFIYFDCCKEFVEVMKNVLYFVDYIGFEFEVLYVDMKKEDIFRRGFEFGVDYSLIWLCYKGG